jgi:hypothetical protein
VGRRAPLLLPRVNLDTEVEVAAASATAARATLAVADLVTVGGCRVVRSPGSARAPGSPRFLTERVRALDHPAICCWRGAGSGGRFERAPAFPWPSNSRLAMAGLRGSFWTRSAPGNVAGSGAHARAAVCGGVHFCSAVRTKSSGRDL